MDNASAGCASKKGSDSHGVADVKRIMGCTSISKMIVLNVL